MIWLGADAGSAVIGWAVLRIVGRDAFWIASGCMEPAEYPTLALLAHEHSVDRAVVEVPGVVNGGEMKARVSGRALRQRVAVLIARANALIETAQIGGRIVGNLERVVSPVYTITARTVRACVCGNEYANDIAVRERVTLMVHGWPGAKRGERRNNNHTRDAAAACLATNLIERRARE